MKCRMCKKQVSALHPIEDMCLKCFNKVKMWRKRNE